MAAPLPPTPTVGYTPVARRRRNGLALIGFLLSLAPVVDALVLFLNVLLDLASTSNPYDPQDLNRVNNIDNVFNAIELVVYVASFVACTGGIVTGVLALSQAKRYPPRQALRGLAIAGIVLSIVGIVMLSCSGLALHACSQPPGC